MRTRIIFTVLGLLLAYSAVYFGDGVRQIWDVTENRDGTTLLIIIGAIIAMVLGVVVWVCTIASINNNDATHVVSSLAVSALILFSAIFGLFAEPFESGPYPWQWVSMWDIVLLLGITPTVLMFVLPKEKE